MPTEPWQGVPADTVPRKRRLAARDARAAELLAAATELFLTRSYAGTKMADISAAAGVARGNVYRYYSSKDDIFAAVMDRMLSREMQTLDSELRDRDPLTALTRSLADMRTSRSLHRALHERLDHSSAVRETHERFLRWMRSMVYEVLDRHPQPVDREMIADLAVALFEGANAPRSPQRPAHELIRFLLEGVIARAGA
ncbi:TetR/AcrR family transcriptional regulator [Streptomyces sp. NBC_01314]|uniref:TetR/AcrR family transcriptional regulator n=1 Tax=Streptomyces sp. NBC_01314 TaxID=2903821 RepID=UPI00308A40F2|nr:TetR/AcrR family transcriptional regulator [Streptomyces sp. NBC_01314]